ncbi:MAG: hypothetical protein ACR2NB_09090 [Solirubrobacteraceae bacterium]
MVRGSDEAVLERARATLDAQTRSPDVRREVVGGWSEAWGVGRGLGADWTWLLDADSVVSEPAALAEFLRVLDAPDDLPEPALLTSRVLAPGGDLAPERAPGQPLLDREVAIAAARRGVVAVRTARWGSLLVAHDVFATLTGPRGDYAPGVADLEWTARILRERPGYLVPRSVARSVGDAAGGPVDPRELRDRMRLVRRRDAWTAQEPVWLAFLLAQDAGRELRTRPWGAPRVLRALARGVRARP